MVPTSFISPLAPCLYLLLLFPGLLCSCHTHYALCLESCFLRYPHGVCTSPSCCFMFNVLFLLRTSNATFKKLHELPPERSFYFPCFIFVYTNPHQLTYYIYLCSVCIFLLEHELYKEKNMRFVCFVSCCILHALNKAWYIVPIQ